MAEQRDRHAGVAAVGPIRRRIGVVRAVSTVVGVVHLGRGDALTYLAVRVIAKKRRQSPPRVIHVRDLTCVAAGAVGAFVSVLQRMSAGKFTVNHEVGREYVTKLATFRPFIGSIFGLAACFAITGGIAHINPPLGPDRRYAFYAFLAFLAGFSERFAKELLGSPSGQDTEEGGDAAPGSLDQP